MAIEEKFLVDSNNNEKDPSKKHYENIAENALLNAINHLNPAFGNKLSGAEGAIEFRDEGVYTYDNKGRRYLDCLGGYGIFNVGHRHPKVVDAVRKQLDQVCLHSQELINWQNSLPRLLLKVSSIRFSVIAEPKPLKVLSNWLVCTPARPKLSRPAMPITASAWVPCLQPEEMFSVSLSNLC